MRSFLPTTYAPYLECLGGFSCFYHAVQRERGLIRYLLGLIHIYNMACCVEATVLEPTYKRQIWVPFAIGLTMHTASVIFIDGVVITTDATTSLLQRLRKVFRVWSNIRRLRLVEDTPINDRLTERTAIRFTIYRMGHLLLLYGLNQVTWSIFKTVELGNAVLTELLNDPFTSHLFPADTGFWQYIVLHIGICFEWVWTTYIVLASTHDLFAIFHVAVLGSDYPSEWPPLFGSLHGAYSLRRFWGAFWPRLHVPVFDAWMPSCHGYRFVSRLCCCRLCCLLDDHCQGDGTSTYETASGRKQIRKAIRALWMFLMSAAYYSLVNGVVLGWQNAQLSVNTGFFLSNWVLCTAETVVGQAVYRRLPDLTPSLFLTAATRLSGFAWVLYILFHLVPDWQYVPLVAITKELMIIT